MIGESNQFSLKDYILSNYQLKDTYILIDEHTEKHCLPIIKAVLGSSQEFEEIKKINIPAGEQNKTMHTVISIAETLSTLNASRDALLINLGGGVLCDIGGFAAAIYKRGIDFINIPTTLLSQVDASIGGKVGVDLDGLKNYLGVFKNPKAVYVSPEFLSTLEQREISAGFAEVIKHGLIADKDYLETIMSHNIIYSAEDQESWSNLIQRSIEIKNQIVLEDPTEKGKRKVLNFGHTVGHAIETFFLETDKPLLHGEAITIGLICELYISSTQVGFSEENRDQIAAFICGCFDIDPLNASQYPSFIKIMYADKKNSGDLINFTLLKEVGTPLINQTAQESIIVEALNYYNSLFT